MSRGSMCSCSPTRTIRIIRLAFRRVGKDLVREDDKSILFPCKYCRVLLRKQKQDQVVCSLFPTAQCDLTLHIQHSDYSGQDDKSLQAQSTSTSSLYSTWPTFSYRRSRMDSGQTDLCLEPFDMASSCCLGSPCHLSPLLLRNIVLTSTGSIPTVFVAWC